LRIVQQPLTTVPGLFFLGAHSKIRAQLLTTAPGLFCMGAHVVSLAILIEAVLADQQELAEVDAQVDLVVPQTLEDQEDQGASQLSAWESAPESALGSGLPCVCTDIGQGSASRPRLRGLFGCQLDLSCQQGWCQTSDSRIFVGNA